MQEYMDTAAAAAEAGGAVLAARAGDLGTVRTKTAGMDLVTEADVASGVAVLRAIAERHEGARFVCEEDEVYALAGVARGALTGPEVWVVDPLDGTTSFVHGYPCWSVSVALLRDGVPVAGAVRNEPGCETFRAATGAGAWLGDRALACSQQADPTAALLGTGFPYDRGEPLTSQLKVLDRLMHVPVRDIRRDGSAAIDCCHVALGRTDGFWEFTLRPWDTAAGCVIAREAGALFTDLHGGPWAPEEQDVLVANPALHAALLAEIAAALA